MNEPYPIIQVAESARELAAIEPMGTKRKFWFRDEGQRWLFKFNRAGTGEDWAEKIGAEVAELLGLPHAHIDLAVYEGQSGIVTRDFVPDGFRLVHGNELLSEIDPAYPAGQNYRVRQHHLSNIRQVFQSLAIGPPQGAPPFEGATAFDFFVGYLMLDALIGNTDRHHENWAVVERAREVEAADRITLAPTFDHASSLGRNESDVRRLQRLDARDPNFTVEMYVAKGRSAIYASNAPQRPISLHNAFRHAAAMAVPAGAAWKRRLSQCDPQLLKQILDRITADRMSEAARQFAFNMLCCSRDLLLGD